MQSIDSIEIYAYETSTDLVSEKVKIKCGNIMKQCKNLMMLQTKTQKKHILN